MADDIVFGIRLTADGSDLVGAVRLSKTELDKLGDSAGKTGRDMSILERGSDMAKRQMDRLRSAGRELHDTLFSLKGLIATVGVTALARSFIEAASTAEQYRVRLTALLGSVEEGNRLFKNMADFASRVPFQYQNVMGAATQLAGVLKGGVDQVTQWMPLIGDLAAVAGLSIETTTEQVVRMISSGAASADMFREKGILGMLSFKAGVSYSAKESAETLIREWTSATSKFKGLTEELAKTWVGRMSMLQDKWFAFRNQVMDQGLFDYIKAVARSFDMELGKKIENNQQQAKAWSDTMITGIEAVIKAVGLLAEAWNKVLIGIKSIELGFEAVKFSVLSATERAAKNVGEYDKFKQDHPILYKITGMGLATDIAKTITGDQSVSEIQKKIDDSAGRMNELQGELFDMINGEPGFNAEERIRAIREELNKTADATEKVKDNTDKMMDGISGSGKEAEAALKKEQNELDEIIEIGRQVANRQRKEMQDYDENLKKRVASLKEELSTEVELENKRYQQGLDLLEQAEKDKIETTMSYNELRLRLEEDHKKKLQDIADKANAEQKRKLEEEAKRQAEIMQRPFINALEGIQSSFTDFFKNIFSGGVNSFRDLASAVKNIFINLASEIASLLVFRPVVGSILGSVGATGLATSLGLTDLGGGSGGGIGSLLNLPFGNLFPGSFTNAIDAFGASIGIGTIAGPGAGLGVAGLSGTAGITQFFATPAAGNVLGGALSSASLSSVLGAAGLGALGGGFISSLLGGDSTAGSLLGGGGSAIGFALGGPVGAVIGSVAGGLLGGLFGGGVPNVTSGYVSNLTGTNAKTVHTKTSGGSSGNELVTSLGTQISAQLGAIADSLGAQLAEDLYFRVNRNFTKDTVKLFASPPGQSSLPDGSTGLKLNSSQYMLIKQKAKSEEDFNAFIQQAAFELFKQPGAVSGLDPRLQSVVDKSQAKDLQGLASDLDFASQLLGIGKYADTAAAALDAINKQFDEMRDRATKLGLSLDLVTKKETEALEALEQQTVDQLSGLVQQARQVLGLDALYQFRESLTFSNLSPLSPTARFAEARSLLDETASAALSGDPEAIKKFPSLAQQVLGLGRDVFASGPQFADLFSAVNKTLNQVIAKQEAIESSFGINLDVAIRETSQDQIKAIRALQDRLEESLRLIRNELAKRAA